MQKKNLENRFHDLINSIYSQSFWTYVQICGLSCVWEIDIKIFAEHLGLDIKKQIKNRSRKNRNTDSLVYEDMSLIIEKIKGKAKHLNIEFKKRARY